MINKRKKKTKIITKNQMTDLKLIALCEMTINPIGEFVSLILEKAKDDDPIEIDSTYGLLLAELYKLEGVAKAIDLFAFKLGFGSNECFVSFFTDKLQSINVLVIEWARSNCVIAKDEYPNFYFSPRH